MKSDHAKGPGAGEARPGLLDPADLDHLLRRLGGRSTRQRRAVYAALAGRRDHPTAEDLHREVRRTIPGLSLGTVYKTLEVLVRAGAASRIDHGASVWRYDSRTEAHDHRRCLGCGRVEDLEAEHRPERIDDLRQDAAEFLVTDYRLEVVGFCSDCGARAGAGSIDSNSTRDVQPTGEHDDPS